MARPLGAAALGAAGSLGVYLGYDYQTCHPMRKMGGYDLDGAGIRLQNILSRNFSSTVFNLEELGEYDGSGGKPMYFSANGCVYDVSESEMFKSAYKIWAGKDATVSLARMSLEPEDANSEKWHYFTADEKETLFSWTHYFGEKYLIKGQLQEFLDDPLDPSLDPLKK